MAPQSWWRDGVLYQIYPRSFGDSDGDGVGDLRGITARLEHLEWLGVDGIWLNPTFPSPNDDWGYDVSDYTAVHPDLGTLEDLDELIAEAGRRGIRVLLDLVPNHTSDRHPWFQDAVGGRDARFRDFYVWADPADGGGPPNNWLSNFGGSAWTFHAPTGQYYLNQFLPTQPDLNWWNEELREAIDEVLEFWFDRGVAGFRIDVCHSIVKDRELRDDPLPGPDDHPHVVKRGLKQVYSMNRPELHDVLRRWRALSARRGDEPVLVGETYVLDLEQLIPFYGLGEDELHLAFNFLFFHCDLDPAQMRPIVEGMEAMLPEGAWPVWTGSNHDGKRLASRWAGGDPARTRAALLILLGLRGTPVLYYGDEIGLPDTPLDPADALDPVAARMGDPEENRDVCRTPMPWSAEAGGGFTPDGAAPWLPFGDLDAHNVAAQREDPGSTAAPRARPDRAAARARGPARRRLRDAARARRRVGVAARRGDGGGREPRRCGRRARGARGAVLLGTDRARDGEAVAGVLRLGARRGRGRGAGVSVEGLDALLADEGWPYASSPPVEPGDPGRFHALFGRDSLICALQVLPARPDVARATLRALARLQGREQHPGTLEEPGKIGHEFRELPAGGLRRLGLAARGPVRLLRHRRRHLVVPRAAGRDRRRRARGRARRGLAGGRRLARGRARARRRLRPLRRGHLGRAQPAGLARRDRPRLRRPTTAASCARTAARRPRRSPTSTPRRPRTRPCARSAGCPATGVGSASPRSCATGSARSDPRRWRSSPTGRSCPGRAPSSAGSCGRARSTATRATPPPSGCAPPTC